MKGKKAILREIRVLLGALAIGYLTVPVVSFFLPGLNLNNFGKFLWFVLGGGAILAIVFVYMPICAIRVGIWLVKQLRSSGEVSM